MAQASSQIRSSTRKITWGTITFIVVLFILSPFSPPKTAMASKSNNAAPIETTTIVRAQAQTVSSQDMVHELLRTHPHPDVRGEFYEMVRDGKIGISWYTGSSAAFVLIPTEILEEFSGTLPGDVFPALLIDPKILLPEMRPIAQIILFHEFVHYQQWHNRRIPQDAFVLKQLESRSSLLDTCTKKWHAEFEAYHQACTFARDTGLIEQIVKGSQAHRVCQSTDDTFAEVLRENLIHSADRVAAKCSEVWAAM